MTGTALDIHFGAIDGLETVLRGKAASVVNQVASVIFVHNEPPQGSDWRGPRVQVTRLSYAPSHVDCPCWETGVYQRVPGCAYHPYDL